MAYDLILMDIDNTLLDFHAGTRDSLTQLLKKHGLDLTPEREQLFHTINDRLWSSYERGEIPKSRIFELRFGEYLGAMGIQTDPLEANGEFARGLQQSAILMPHCRELLEALKGRYRLIGVTNAVVSTQLPRLEKSGLNNYLEQVFISEAMGCKKPEREFFDQVFASIGVTDRSRAILLGDSLTSDMQGGRNAGITTCFLGKDTGDPRYDYVIADLLDFLSVLER